MPTNIIYDEEDGGWGHGNVMARGSGPRDNPVILITKLSYDVSRVMTTCETYFNWTPPRKNK